MSKVCVKCTAESSIILVGTNGSFCKDCFEKYFTHKFRASLGKNPIVRHGERVAVAFSGGNNSSALLRLLVESLSPTAFKRLKFHPGIIFVDETSLFPNHDLTKEVSNVQEFMEGSGLPYAIVQLEEVLSYGTSNSRDNDQNVEMKEKLSALFDAIKTVTGKEELLYRMRCKLIAYKAKELGYQHVFLGETSTRLAVNILSNIAQGRGAHLPLDTGFSDGGRFDGVNLLRPLRDTSSKEIVVYNALHNVPTVFFPTFSTKLQPTSSIQKLTEDFIVSLSANFPSTETTVYRTSNKLQTSKSQNSKLLPNTTVGQVENCSLCCGPLDTRVDTGQANALHAMQFTESLSAGEFGCPSASNLPIYLIENKDGCDVELTDTQSVSQKNIERNSATADCDTASMCHACQILYKDLKRDEQSMNSKEIFSDILVRRTKKLTEQEMKDKLEGLLIDS